MTDTGYYDLQTHKFVKEFTVDDEAITNYRVLDGKLVITGTDAMEPWDFGNIYVLTDKGWVKYRNIHNAVHVLDIESFKGKWFAGTGTVRKAESGQEIAPGAVFSSADQGQTWTRSVETGVTGEVFSRVHSLAVFKDRLFAFSNNTHNKSGPMLDPYGEIDALAYDGAAWRSLDIIPAQQIRRTEAYAFGDKLLLKVTTRPGAGGFSVYLYAYDGKNTEKLDSLQYSNIGDIVVKPDRLLAMIRNKQGQLEIAETRDLKTWVYYAFSDSTRQELMPARLPAYPLPTIEYDNGVFYIGTRDGAVYMSAGFE
jgi:hypothetical protein